MLERLQGVLLRKVWAQFCLLESAGQEEVTGCCPSGDSHGTGAQFGSGLDKHLMQTGLSAPRSLVDMTVKCDVPGALQVDVFLIRSTIPSLRLSRASVESH